VDTGSREENASKQESRAPFRFYRNGNGSSQTAIGPNAIMTLRKIDSHAPQRTFQSSVHGTPQGCKFNIQ
jgi:hypothetical protein